MSTDLPTPPQRNWLCIAHSFPPVNRSGTFRTLGFVRHLDRMGWHATVLTAQPGVEPTDDALGGLIPAGTAVLPVRSVNVLQVLKRLQRRLSGMGSANHPFAESARVESVAARKPFRGISDLATELISTPDSRTGWIPWALAAGLRTLRARPFDVLYSTSPCMSAHLVALLLKRWTGIPWVADFRDPWRGNGFRRENHRWVEGWDGFLEARVLHGADRIVCNTSTAQRELERRCPFVRGKCRTIPNGVDFDLLQGIEPTRDDPADCFVLAHCGQFYGPRSPIPWFRALNHIRLRDPALAGKLRFLSVGCESYEGVPLARLAQQEGVADLVRALPNQSHRAALQITAGADAVIVAGAAGPGAHVQIPNKLFEYIGLRKPMIVAIDEQSPALDMLAAAKGQWVRCPPGDPQSIACAITQIMAPGGADTGNWSGAPQLNRRHCAAKLRELFEGLVGPAHSQTHEATCAAFSTARLADVPILRAESQGKRTTPECSMRR